MKTITPDAEMLRDYVQRKLSPEQEEQVELWLAENPAAVTELEFDLALKEAITKAPDPRPAQDRTETPFWLRWLMRPAFAGAMAISLLAAIVTPTALFLAADARNEDLNQRLTRLGPQSSGLRSVSIVDLSASRGGDTVDAVLRLPERDADVVFRVFVSDPGFPSYRVRLIDDGSIDRTSSGLKLGHDDSLSVRLDAERISGRLRLVVYGQRGEDAVEIEDYLIDIL